MEHKGQYSIKNLNSHVYVVCSCTQMSLLRTCFHQKQKACGIARNLCFLGKASNFCMNRTRLMELTEGEFFLIMLQPLCISTSLPSPLPPPAPPPQQHSVICHHWCPFSPLWSPCPAYTLTPTPSLLFHIASSWAICFPGCGFSQLLGGLGFFLGWVGPLWNWGGVLYIYDEIHKGFSPWHSHVSQPTLPGQQPQDHLAHHMVSFPALISTRHLWMPVNFAYDSS